MSPTKKTSANKTSANKTSAAQAVKKAVAKVKTRVAATVATARVAKTERVSAKSEARAEKTSRGRARSATREAAADKTGRARAKSATAPKAAGQRAPKLADAATIREIVQRLERAIRSPECELDFGSPFELLTATILAAQSTDKTVNQVMPVLLARYPDAEALAKSEQADVEALVKRTGFFRNKAKAIRGMAQALVAEHGGRVPRTIEQMVELPGVARKTANVVLGTAYGISSGFVVDTHVTRLAARLALSAQTDPVRIEQDLCKLFPADTWVDTGHRLILHGRYTCLAKRPMCEACPINEQCPSRQALPVDAWTVRADREDERTRAGLQASRVR